MEESSHSRCNHFVQHFHNRVKSLYPVTKEIADDLLIINSRTTAVIPQVPPYGDLDVLSGLLAIISELGMTINWNNLNKPYYWEDFSTESKVIIDKVPSLKKRISGIYGKAKKLCTLCDGLFSFVEPIRAETMQDEQELLHSKRTFHLEDTDLKMIQLRHSPPVGIKFLWNNFKHEIEAKYQNPDGAFSEEVIKVSTDKMKIRILRYLMNYTRVLVDSSCVTLAKIEVILDKHIPIDELQKCDVVNENKLTPYEFSMILEAKSVMDAALMKIYESASILKYHYKSHKAFVDVLKKIKPNKTPEPAKNFISLELCVDDIIFINFWLRQVQHLDDEDQEEDPLPVILQDRSDDTLEIIGDMMNFSTGYFQKIEAIIFLLKKCEWNVFEEQPDPKNRVRIALNGIKENLKPLKRYLEKSIKWAKTDKILQRFFPDILQMKEFRETREGNPDNLWNIKNFKGEDAYIWIHLTEDHRISFIKEVVTLRNSMDEFKAFVDLPLKERVSVVMKLLENLDKVIGYCRIFIENGFDRVKYTTVLTKRLTQIDQTSTPLGTYVIKGVGELNLLLELIKEIETLQKIIV